MARPAPPVWRRPLEPEHVLKRRNTGSKAAGVRWHARMHASFILSSTGGPAMQRSRQCATAALCARQAPPNASGSGTTGVEVRCR